MGILKKFEGFTIWSENYKELAKWYMEKFELKQTLELNQPEDMTVALEIEPGSDLMLWIGYHSEVKGKSKDTYRIMISYIVDDVYSAYEILSGRGVEFIAKPRLTPTGDLNVATAVDPEGNLIQLFSKVS